MAFCNSMPGDGLCKTTPFEESLRVLKQHVPGSTNVGLLTHNFVEPRDVIPTLTKAAGFPEIPPFSLSDPLLRVNQYNEKQSMPPHVAYPDAAGWREQVVSQASIDGRGMQYVAKDTVRYSVTDPRYHNVYPGFNAPDNTAMLQNNIKGYVTKALSEQYGQSFDPYISRGQINPDDPVKSTIQAWEQACYGMIINKLG